jgi:hypothetical protein
VTLSHYVDAKLMYDAVMGRSVTGIFHLVNKTPIEWYSKKQATVETATYGSEFIPVHVCIEQIIDQHNTLQYLGVHIRDKNGTCLVTTIQWLIAQCNSMPNYVSGIPKLLHLEYLDSISCQVITSKLTY